MKNILLKIFISSVAITFSLVSTVNAESANSAQQAKIDHDLAEAKLNRIQKRAQADQNIDGIDAVNLRKDAELANIEREKMAEAELEMKRHAAKELLNN